jgi:hypothetical protein
VKYSVALVLWERGLIPEFISRIYLINVDTMDTLYWAMVIFLKGG